MSRFVDVIMPLPLFLRFTYSVPERLLGGAEPGSRLVVPFGKVKKHIALSVRLHDEKPLGYDVKEVIDTLDTEPVLLPDQIKLLFWISEYYLCAEGDVMKSFLPSGTRLDREGGSAFLRSASANCLRLSQNISSQEFSLLFDKYRNAPRRLEILRMFLKLGQREGSDLASLVVSKKELLEACSSASALKWLTDNNILSVCHSPVRTRNVNGYGIDSPKVLNSEQSRALLEIKNAFAHEKVCLLHGVTSSGKTEIYTHLIRENIESGLQVLYLLPEIALTAQITNRLQKIFGDCMCVYHSGRTDLERAEIRERQLGKFPFKLVLGARSALFLPFRKLGLVIVDEEHEPNYKQEDPAPRYNVRNAAIVLARISNATVLLGSATPSVESYYNAVSGKYSLVTIKERYLNLVMPEIILVDIKEQKRKKIMRGIFSPLLIEKIKLALLEKEQVILFQNRRGYYPVLECSSCGWIPRCDTCDVALTYHRISREAKCHYCGKRYKVPPVCPECGNERLEGRGFGTERVEEEVMKFFPQARVSRLDYDTAGYRDQAESIINDFQERRTDILIGTQMVSKGLDFDNVRVVGILLADSILNYPDFRSVERAYQMMAQVSGRAGRKNKRGTVILQTRQIDNEVIRQIVRNDYEGMFRNQIEEREQFLYPPFCRLIAVYVKGKAERDVFHAADLLAVELRGSFKDRILGPETPPVARVQSYFYRKMLIKIDSSISDKASRRKLVEIKRLLEKSAPFRKVIIYFDADPV